MANKQVAWNKTTRTATVQLDGAGLPSGSELAGKYVHPDTSDALSRNQYSHVTYQHVQDIMYRKYNWQDMQPVVIVDTTVVKATALAIAPASLILVMGQVATKLVPTITPANATDTRVDFSSDNPLIAVVDKFGNVSPRGKGKTQVYARTRDGSRLATIVPVDVRLTAPVAVTGVTLTPETSTGDVGSTVQLTAVVAPVNADNKAVTYVSSVPAVASVSATGLVTRLTAGTTNITVTTVSGGKTAVSVITVTAP